MLIDQMREIAVQIDQVRHERIGKIERDIENFARDVGASWPRLHPIWLNAVPKTQS